MWLQLMSDATVLPSGMSHFILLHEEVRERSLRGDVSILARALDQVIWDWERLTDDASLHVVLLHRPLAQP